jgi:pyruvate,orthophosphate dikinase
MTDKKRVYLFGDGKAEGDASMKNLLGGKGANLCEMNKIGVPVPPGFTITTEVCTEYNSLGKEKVREFLTKEVTFAINEIEKSMKKKFNDLENPLLVSVRSGSRVSMPGMMDTVLNLGLNDKTVEALAKISNNERFAWDSYRRFVQMYGDVVLGMKPKSKEDHDPFEEIIDEMKKKKGVQFDNQLDANDLKELVRLFKLKVHEYLNKDFPTDPWEQLWGAIYAVFESWMNERAVYYRKMNNYPEEWGTAVSVQAMVFGNSGDSSATGVAFTRDAATGEKIFNGEFLINAQGEDVVAGIRTPQQITLEGSKRWAIQQNVDENIRKTNFPSLEEVMPDVFDSLNKTQKKLEDHYKDMQDLEFTIENKKLWLLQTRNAKRTGGSQVRCAFEMLKEGLIDEKTAINRVEPKKLDELLHPIFTSEALAGAKILAKGLPASPGAACGQIVFFADEAEEWVKNHKKVILVRIETSPEDLRGMSVSEGILTCRGGMTSHAAVVARGMGKCCISGAETLVVDYKARTILVNGQTFKEGDFISLNGTTGEVYEGKLETKDPELSGNFVELMNLAEKYTKLHVRTNADTPKDAESARGFGAVGIGLCRTEHMFFEGVKIKPMREMILSTDETGRRKALAKLLPLQRTDFEGIFEAMQGLPVTIRLLDPPLHEFVPHDDANQEEMAKEMGISIHVIKHRVESLKEFNPMLGHRGCRLGITYPEITEMQTRAIIEAALNLKAKGITALPEIMIPLVGTVNEFKNQENIIRKTAEKVFAERNDKIVYYVGTMIEIPRAALLADEIAQHAEFFSFGTNDLTQMTFGYSRDDAGKFLPFYTDYKIIPSDPFQTLDVHGVGKLVEMATKNGRNANKNLHIGICGEHGGDPDSVTFCHLVGMDYVSCSPFRVPIARLAAAQAAINNN